MTEQTDRMGAEIARRRTFAIISHPDAGKTTLTEHLLRAGGAIQLAGSVRAKGERRRTRSDWMNIERERGISVVTSVMTFEYAGCVFNLLDTPGHEDFSEDTYRTLTAVDSAVMVIDAAKGIEERTRKLLEICRLRDIPILTFINKMDRETRDPFELLDEIAATLALDTAPVTWPIGRAADFAGTYDIRHRDIHLTSELPQSDPSLQALGDELELVHAALPEFDTASFAEGHLTPVYFGSALKGIGVADLLQGLAEYGPRPRSQPADRRVVEATESTLTALVFKIQANMDPNHRDRIAFARVCSGRLTRGMRLKQVRTGKLIPLHAPQFFFARARAC
jgi:peptide chain release factor 3